MTHSLSATRSRLGHRIQTLRSDAGMSIGALARAAGLAKTSISNIEGGLSNPSLETLWRLADALGVSLGALLHTDAGDRIQVIRSGQGAPFSSPSGLSGRLLFASGPSGRTEVTVTTMVPGTNHMSAPHPPGTRELIYCLSGDLAVGPLGDEHELTCDDAAIFTADEPHSYVSASGAQVIVLMTSQHAR